MNKWGEVCVDATVNPFPQTRYIPLNPQMRSGLYWTTPLLVALASAPAFGQPAVDQRPNRVLDLNGKGAYAELPAGLFTNRVVTIEGWAKWRAFNNYSRFFELTGEQAEIGLANFGRDSSLFLEVPRRDKKRSIIGYYTYSVPGLLSKDSWCHLAVVCRSNALTIYFNGVPLPIPQQAGDWVPEGTPRGNLIGRSPHLAWGNQGDAAFDGQIDELRLWAGERNQSQIIENMSKRLTGNEPGLLGLWNFDDPARPGKDASPSGHEARLMDGAKVLEGQLPQLSDTLNPSILSGSVFDNGGHKLADVLLDLEVNGVRMARAVTSASGDFIYAPDLSLGTNRFEIVARRGDLGTRSIQSPLRSGEQRAVRLELLPDVSLTGQVLALDDSPLPGVLMQLVPEGLDEQPSSAAAKAVTVLDANGPESVAGTLADGMGRFHFVHVPGGRYQLRCGSNSGYLYSLTNLVLPSPEPVRIRIPPFKKGQWTTLGEKAGLSSDWVSALRATPEGTIWAACWEDGISRYRGGKFHSLRPEPAMRSSRATGCIEEAGDGAVWYTADSGGVVRLVPEPGPELHGQFTLFTTTSGLPDKRVRAIRADAGGKVWFATDRGLALYDPQAKNFHPDRPITLFAMTNGLPEGRAVLAVERSKDGSLWIGNMTGISQVAGTNVVNWGRESGLKHGARWIREDDDGVLWCGAGDQWLSRFDGRTWHTMNLPGFTMQESITCVYRDRRKQVWVGTDGQGAWRFDGHAWVNFRQSDGLAFDRVFSITSSPDGTVWFGTAGGGVSAYNDAVCNYNQADGLAWNTILECRTDEAGVLWASSNSGGIDVYAAVVGGVSRWDGSRFETFTRADGLADSRAGCPRVGPDGRMWFSTWSKYVSIYNGKSFQTLELPAEVIWCYGMSFDRRGNAWFGTQGAGVVRYDGKQFESLNKENSGLPDNSCKHGFDGTGRLWVASDYGNGLSYFPADVLASGNPAKCQRFKETNILSPKNVLTLFTAHDGAMWVNGMDGVFRYDGARFQPVTASIKGFPTRTVLSLFEDSNNRMWMGTAAGAVCYDGELWSALDRRDGLADDRVNSITEDKEGNLWFGTPQGLTRYRPRRSVAPAPSISLQDDRTYFEPEMFPTLTTGRRITFHFDVTDLRTAPEKRQFRCCWMAGHKSARDFDTGSWESPQFSSSLDFTPKKSGLFTLAVQYVDRDLNRSEPALAVLHFIPPWYQNARIAGPMLGGLAALVSLSAFSTARYSRKRRETARLRAQMLDQERHARMVLEAANSSLAAAKEEAEAARISADEASQAKSRFLANMSHELRTPLNAIIGYSEMLREEASDEGHQIYISDLEKIQGAGKHLLGLINDILDLSKVEAGKMTLFLERFELESVVREVAQTVQPLVAKNGNRLELDCPPALGMIKADLTKVRQVLFNLLSNASKFTQNGSVRVSVRRESGQPARIEENKDESGPLETIAIDVTDTGIGMTEAQLSGLFQAFAQADAGTTRKYGGTGLGLALSRSFCRLMGGDLQVRSEPGKGSVFSVTLPAEVSDATSKKGRPERSSSRREQQGPLILVIDDDENARELAERALTNEGYRVALAANGEQGLEVANRIKPSLILLDVIMPGLDGWAVLSSLKQHAQLRQIPVVMMTILHDRNLAFSLGATDYLTKPVQWDQLWALLEKHHLSSGQPRILVVDDDARSRDLLRRGLEKSGCSVQEAENGRIAQAALTPSPPQLILLDLLMPEMDGFEFLHLCRQNPETRNIPVIVITSKDLTHEDLKRLHGSATKVLQKGAYDLSALVQQVRTLLRPPENSN